MALQRRMDGVGARQGGYGGSSKSGRAYQETSCHLQTCIPEGYRSVPWRWQRAEDRTQNTARLYNDLGMAEYQAIEVFVKLF